jgi:hypothetical protein
MSDVPNILHEEDVREVIQDEIETSVGLDQTAIANASVAHALNASFSDTEVEAALNALGGKVNALIAALVAAGILEASA